MKDEGNNFPRVVAFLLHLDKSVADIDNLFNFSSRIFQYCINNKRNLVINWKYNETWLACVFVCLFPHHAKITYLIWK